MEEVAAEPTETPQENRIQVSNTKKPLFFYVNLAKVRLAKATALSARAHRVDGPCCASCVITTQVWACGASALVWSAQRGERAVLDDAVLPRVMVMEQRNPPGRCRSRPTPHLSD